MGQEEGQAAGLSWDSPAKESEAGDDQADTLGRARGMKWLGYSPPTALWAPDISRRRNLLVVPPTRGVGVGGVRTWSPPPQHLPQGQ